MSFVFFLMFYLQILESLRQTSNDNPTASTAAVARLPPTQISSSPSSNTSATAMSPRAVMKTQPQMIRSNSSGGVTMNNSNNSMGKLQRHRTAADGSMSTFSSFRGTSGSPKRSFNPDQRIPALADLEFPPPPLDLPPPVRYFY